MKWYVNILLSRAARAQRATGFLGCQQKIYVGPGARGTDGFRSYLRSAIVPRLNMFYSSNYPTRLVANFNNCLNQRISEYFRRIKTFSRQLNVVNGRSGRICLRPDKEVINLSQLEYAGWLHWLGLDIFFQAISHKWNLIYNWYLKLL